MVCKQTPLIRYQYDALNRLTHHSLQGGVDRQRFYCENRLVTEIEGGEQVSIVQHGDQLLAQQRRNSDGLDNTLLAMDQQRSVLNTLQANCQRPISYSPYGYHRCESGLTSLLGFNGQRPDPWTGHYLLGNGYRAFNSVLMRFNSPDSYSPFNSGGLNCYAYCEGDPTNRFDPSGHFSFKSFFQSRQTLQLSQPWARMSRRGDVLEAHQAWQAGVQHSRSVNSVPFRSLNNVRRVSEGIFTGVSEGKNGKKLHVIGHGLPGLIVVSCNRSTDAKGLDRILQASGINYKDYNSARIFTCHSASGVAGAPSLAKSFAHLSGLDVKGYRGAITTNSNTAFESLGVGESSSQMHLFKVYKGRSEYSLATMRRLRSNYDPQVFSPGALDQSRDDIRR
jgi:RHS repeat-associated protein